MLQLTLYSHLWKLFTKCVFYRVSIHQLSQLLKHKWILKTKRTTLGYLTHGGNTVFENVFKYLSRFI